MILKIGFSIIFEMIAYWFGVSVPLVFFGSFIGFKKSVIETPFDYNIVPK